MSAWPLHPRGFDGDGMPDGRYGVTVVSGKVTGWVQLPSTAVGSVGHGTRIAIDATDPTNPIVSLATEQYVLTEVVWDGSNWVTELVADGGSHELMYLEVPIP